MLELKKETLRKRNGYDSELENSFDLLSFRPEKFNLPEVWNREAMQNLNANLTKFKDAIQIGDFTESRVENKKDDCVKGVKEVLRNYK